MNLQAIIVANCIGIAILVVLLVSSHLVRQRRDPSDRLFTAMIILTISACLMEMITFIIDGRHYPGALAVDTITNTFLFIVNPVVCFMWVEYTDLRLYRSEERIRSTFIIRSLPMLLSIAALIPNMWMNFVFSFDEELVYHREPLGYSYYAVTFGYLMSSIILRHKYYSRYGKNRFFPIYMFLAPIFIGATIQFFVYGVSLAWCSVSLGLVGIYMSLQNELSYIDPLTSLYNRSYLNTVLRDLSRRKSPAGGIMIDLDYFKVINDTYGHTTGDVALSEAANIIRMAAPDNSVTVRYAGDEFIVILRTGDDKKLRDIIGSIRKGVELFNRTGGHEYTLSFSIGYSIYEGKRVSCARNICVDS